MVDWEIRGLFGNEYAMESAVEELKKMGGLECVVIDRRNLSVRLKKRDKQLEERVKRAIEIHHGFVEAESQLGDFDRKKERMRRKKLEEIEKKRRLATKQH